MSWSWSHTPEAYSNAKQNWENLDYSQQCTIAAEWYMHDLETNTDLDLDEIIAMVTDKEAAYLKYKLLVPFEEIWGKIENQRTCDIGGSNAWVCPSGCHTVPFDLSPNLSDLVVESL